MYCTWHQIKIQEAWEEAAKEMNAYTKWKETVTSPIQLDF